MMVMPARTTSVRAAPAARARSTATMVIFARQIAAVPEPARTRLIRAVSIPVVTACVPSMTARTAATARKIAMARREVGRRSATVAARASAAATEGVPAMATPARRALPSRRSIRTRWDWRRRELRKPGLLRRRELRERELLERELRMQGQPERDPQEPQELRGKQELCARRSHFLSR